MSRQWIRENPPQWDAPKETIVGGAPAGTFEMRTDFEPGDLLPGDWWRVEDGGDVVAYGWMDTNWGGEAQILLAVAPARRRAGLGAFVLERLEREAAARGLNYLFNEVSPRHPDREGVTRWLERHGFKASPEGRSLRRPVRARGGRP